MRSSVKMYVPLLLCVLIAEASTTTSIPETKSINVEANDTTKRPTTAHVNVLQSAAWTPEHKPEEAPAEKAMANETSGTTTVSTITSSSVGNRDGSAIVTAAAAGTSSSGLPASTEGLITKPPAGTTARAAAEPSTAVSTATTETPPTSTTRTTAEARTSVEVSTARGEPSTAVTTALIETQPSIVVTTAKDEDGLSFSTTAATSRAQSLNYTTADVLNHTADQLLQSSTSSFTNETATATSSASATATVSSLQPTSITGNPSELPSTTSLNNETVWIFNQTLSRPTASSPTSKKSETSPPTSPELSSTRKSASTMSPLSSTARPSETASPSTTDSPSSTTGNSTSAAGILIPLKPKRLPFPTTRLAPAATIARCEPSKDPTSNQIQPCSTRGMANQCLIIIASLAAVATIFMVSTIVLCVKLSARNYKVTKPQSTEMMCISSLLPEKTYNYTRHRNPVSNGVLVYPTGGDSDEEGGDNLTLSSFLPDNDRYV